MTPEERQKRSGLVFVSPRSGLPSDIASYIPPSMLQGRRERKIPRIMRERLSIVKALAGHGYRVLMPVGEGEEINERRFVNLAKRQGVRTFKFKTLKSPDDREWLRDRWTQVGQGIFFPPGFGVISESREHVDDMRGLTSRRIVPSPLGTGGRVVSGRDFILVQRNPDYHAVKPDVTRLERGGWKVYAMPSPPHAAPREDVVQFTHIDLHVGIAPTKNGGHLILANKKYLADNRALFDRIARETGSKIVQVPEKEEALFPTNFLVLPDGKVLMTGGAPKTKALMEREGIRVYTTIPLKETVKLEGGLRCLTNTFYPKQKKRPVSEAFSRK